MNGHEPLSPLSPGELLTRARQMSSARSASEESANAGAASYWPRAAALLARMALESSVTAAVATIDPQLVDASMRTKLLVLLLVMPEPIVSSADVAWAGLSRACHQHPYELAPTRAEVAALIESVEVVLVQPMSSTIP